MHAKRKPPRLVLLALLAAAVAIVAWPSPKALSSTTSQSAHVTAIRPAVDDGPGSVILTSALKQAALHRTTLTAAVQPAPTYTVRSGDTLSSIAQHLGLAWQVLWWANHGLVKDPASITAGWVLVVPPAAPVPGWLASAANAAIYPAGPAIVVTAASSAPAPAPSAQPAGSLQTYAQGLLNARGWGSQFGCLNGIIMIESSWNIFASNASGAYGIPQALPGSKMAVAGADWRTDGDTQLRWMIDDYIGPDYGSPCNAYAHEQADGWY